MQLPITPATASVAPVAANGAGARPHQGVNSLSAEPHGGAVQLNPGSKAVDLTLAFRDFQGLSAREIKP